MAAMTDVFIRGRDVEVFLNSLTQNKSIKLAIPEIKKKIKYCNTMEKKQLQRKLNEAYKE